jgi:CIC family chloride channel protein
MEPQHVTIPSRARVFDAARAMILAVTVGVLAAVGAFLFHAIIALFHNLFFFGRFSFAYDAAAHTPASPLGAWIIVVPVVGALIVAFLVRDFAHEARGAGVAEVIDAVYYHRGVIRSAVAWVKTLAASVSLGSGGAVGREGPIIQIGATLGSAFGQWVRVPAWQRTMLVAAGASAGIAATFNAPAAGILFAVEMILPETSVRTLVPVMLAAVSATEIGRTLLGTGTLLAFPSVSIPLSGAPGMEALGFYALLGVALGLVSLLFIRTVYAFEDGFQRIPGNYYIRHALGMAVVGVILYLLARYSGHYYVQGLSYATVHDIVVGQIVSWRFLLLLLVLKLLATSLTLGSGSSGGIFSPSLFLGAALGAAYAQILGPWLPAALQAQLPGAVLAGMGGLVAGATGAVLTAVVMIVELTGNYAAIVPLLLTAALAYGVRRIWLRHNMYSMKLHRRGHHIPDFLQTNVYLLRAVQDVLPTPCIFIDLAAGEDAEAVEVATEMAHGIGVDGHQVLGVLDAGWMQELRRRGAPRAQWRAALDTRFAVVAARAAVADVLVAMRSRDCVYALVTEDGNVHGASSVLGVVSRDELLQGGVLPDEWE